MNNKSKSAVLSKVDVTRYQSIQNILIRGKKKDENQSSFYSLPSSKILDPTLNKVVNPQQSNLQTLNILQKQIGKMQQPKKKEQVLMIIRDLEKVDASKNDQDEGYEYYFTERDLPKFISILEYCKALYDKY